MTYTGVDIVHIPRFEAWLNYKEAQLLTIFTSREIEELAKRAPNQTQFLASRFAVKEAFYKALSTACSSHVAIQPFGFRTIARFIEIVPEPRWKCPTILFDAESFHAATGIALPKIHTSTSLAHDHEYTIAQVLITLL